MLRASVRLVANALPGEGVRFVVAVRRQGRNTEDRFHLAHGLFRLLDVVNKAVEMFADLLRVVHSDRLVADQLQYILNGGALRVNDLAIFLDLVVFFNPLLQDLDALAVDLLYFWQLLVDALAELVDFSADAVRAGGSQIFTVMVGRIQEPHIGLRQPVELNIHLVDEHLRSCRKPPVVLANPFANRIEVAVSQAHFRGQFVEHGVQGHELSAFLRRILPRSDQPLEAGVMRYDAKVDELQPGGENQWQSAEGDQGKQAGRAQCDQVVLPLERSFNVTERAIVAIVHLNAHSHLPLAWRSP